MSESRLRDDADWLRGVAAFAFGELVAFADRLTSDEMRREIEDIAGRIAREADIEHPVAREWARRYELRLTRGDGER